MALSAAALSALPGARPWLPLVVAVTPGVIASLVLGLSDTLALALTLLAFAAAAHRRWAVLVVALVLAALAKETAFLAAPALALTPGMPVRARLAAVAVPATVLLGWVAWVNHALSASLSTASQFAGPLSGWIHSTDTATGLALALLLAITIAVGAWRARGAARAPTSDRAPRPDDRARDRHHRVVDRHVALRHRRPAAGGLGHHLRCMRTRLSLCPASR